jgi:hypothetical protein
MRLPVQERPIREAFIPLSLPRSQYITVAPLNTEQEGIEQPFIQRCEEETGWHCPSRTLLTAYNRACCSWWTTRMQVRCPICKQRVMYVRDMPSWNHLVQQRRQQFTNNVHYSRCNERSDERGYRGCCLGTFLLVPLSTVNLWLIDF